MRLVDAHTHVVSRDSERYPRAPASEADHPWHLERPVEVDEMLGFAEASGVSALVLVQALSCHGYDNRYVLDSAARLAGRAAAVVAMAPDAPGSVSKLRSTAADGPVHGVRLYCTPTGPASPLDTPEVLAVASAAGDLGIPVVLLALAPQLPSVRRLAAARPAVTFVLDHCGFADLGGDGTFPRAADLFALADEANVVAKVSSLTLRSTPHPAALWQALIERFGAARLVWGSDHPHADGPGYAPLVALARDTTAGLTPSDRASVLGGTACRLWPTLA